MVKFRFKVYDIALIASLTAILFVQEQLLSSIPGVQLTIFLLVLFSKKLGFIRSALIVVVHVVLDNIYMNSFSLFYTPAMLVGWLIIPITICSIFKKVESSFCLGVLGVLYAFIYCWLFIIPNYFILNIGPIEYLISDFLFEIILAISSFVSIYWLYNPCGKVLDFLKK